MRKTAPYYRIAALNSFIIHVGLCLLASCTTMKDYRLYNGPKLPNDQTALLVNKGDFILIHSINGIKNPSGEQTYEPGKIEVLPGVHSLTISFYRISTSSELAGNYYYDVFFRNTSTSHVEVDVKTEVGRQYLLTAEYDYEKLQWSFVVIDEANKQKVLVVGPYPLNRVRTGDNRAIRRLPLRGR